MRERERLGDRLCSSTFPQLKVEEALDKFIFPMRSTHLKEQLCDVRTSHIQWYRSEHDLQQLEERIFKAVKICPELHIAYSMLPSPLSTQGGGYLAVGPPCL